ncbi:MAG: cysteine--tRNA ligase, partial [Candidatus Yonathbacteria bacterium]|nr:cysteine--tRNA ligase [Candidatus Yonathbacteria bacterium]
MDLTFYNTLTDKKEIFVPLKKNNVSIYQCGPTVYDYAHIGNLRAAITNDILRRVFEYAGYKVNQVMNITDIDDKTIGRSKEERIPLSELTRKYEDFYFADLRNLNIKIPEHLPHATNHIGGMIAMIEKLLWKGFAYTTTDGVYFDVSKSKNYGALAKLDLTAETQSRAGGEDKKNERDFALWKFWTPDDGPVAFDASFGRGRPGWHIECSVMAMSELGETLDIHAGGIDLIFPHHTNEIAQSEAVTGKPFVNLWIHNEFVMIDGQKMSKSLGNHTTLKTVLGHKIMPLAFRYWVLGTHYRTHANFTWEAIDGAQNALRKLSAHIGEGVGVINESYRKRFLEIIANDLDMPRALALAWEVTKDTSLSNAEK